MDPVSMVVGLSLGFFIGAMVAAVTVRFLLKARYRVTEVQAAQLESVETQRNQIQDHLRQVEREVICLQKEKELMEAHVQWTGQAEAKLREAFDSLASKALRHNSEELTQQASERLRALVEPLAKGLDRLDLQVVNLESNRAGAYAGLSQQVAALLQSNRELQQAATSLGSALRHSRNRGRWGEVQLRRIVEMAGMVDHVDFEEQTTTKEAGRPDMVVRLPNGGVIPVDAKTPMDAYLDAHEATNEASSQGATKTAATNEATFQRHMQAHARAMRSHIQELAKKKYWEQFDQAPDFVVMLVPYESGLSAAFTTCPGLFEEALDHQVFIASPVSLLALLRICALGWMQVDLAHNAKAIADQGRELSDRFETFLDHLGRVGSQLNSAVDSYNKAVGSAEHRLIPALRRMNQMGVSSNKAAGPSTVDLTARSIGNLQT